MEFDKKVLLCGCFDFETLDHGGQPVKSRELYWALKNRIGDRVSFFETKNWKKRPLGSLARLTRVMGKNDVLVMLPARNGLKVFAVLFTLARLFNRKKELHYAVVGGWLPEMMMRHAALCKMLKRFDRIYVETSTMKTKLEALGFENTVILPNAKTLKILSEDVLVCDFSEPLKLCTFSRVMKEKGIEDAITAVTKVNDRFGKTVFSLDIYGQVDGSQVGWFESLKSAFPDFVEYKGVVEYDQSADVLKNYFALLFPTGFYTEGIPGTVVDAFAAGVPVISSKWESFADVIDDGVTGIGYEFSNTEKLTECLTALANDPEKIIPMKKQCILRAKDFAPEKAVSVMLEQ